MIALATWNKLVKEWESKVGPAYQIPRRSKDRLVHFCKHCIPHLKDKAVVEIGANAGIFGYEIAKVAKRYIGVEPANKVREAKKEKPRTDYFKQAQITLEQIKEFNPNAVFLHDTIPEFCKREFTGNAFVACFALYHFLNHEIDLLKEHVWPRCDVVIIQNRVQDRPKQHNKYKFYKTKNVVEFFEQLGFGVNVVSAMSENKRQKYDEVICHRLKHE